MNKRISTGTRVYNQEMYFMINAIIGGILYLTYPDGSGRLISLEQDHEIDHLRQALSRRSSGLQMG